MRSRIMPYAPLAVSVTMGLLIIVQMLLMVQFGDAVISYYTPTILAFDNLMEGSQHLKHTATNGQYARGQDNIAAKHFLFALDKLATVEAPTWPKAKRDNLRDLLEAANKVRSAVAQSDYAQVDAALDSMMPLLEMHTMEHRSELVSAKHNIRNLTVGIGFVCLSLLGMGYAATLRERRLSKLEASEAEIRSVLAALITALDAREAYTKGHSVRVAEYSVGIANKLGLSQAAQQQLHMAALLHDIGKIGVPDSVLLKPGRLSDEEFAVMATHPDTGARILASVKTLAGILPGIRHHHERHDGKGYPDGLAGDRIPLSARIIALADAYDAMTTDRPYRQGLPPALAKLELQDKRDRQWSGEVVDAFLAAREEREV